MSVVASFLASFCQQAGNSLPKRRQCLANKLAKTRIVLPEQSELFKASLICQCHKSLCVVFQFEHYNGVFSFSQHTGWYG